MEELTENKKEGPERFIEWAALFAVIHYCFFRFFESSTFYFDFTDRYRKITFGSLVLIGVLRLLIGLWNDLRASENQEAKTAVFLKGLLSAAAAVPCVLIANRFGYTFFAYMPFIAYCLYGMKAEKILKAFTVAVGTLLLCTIICSLTGAIQNYLYINDKGKLRSSYGISYPTDFASYFIYLFVFVWAIQKKHAWWHTGLFILLALTLCLMISSYPHSDTSTLMSFICALVVLYEALDHWFLSRYKGTRWISKAGEGLVTGAFPILGIGFLALTWLYGQGNGIAVRIDKWMSSRLVNTWQHYLKYGLNALGALTPQNGFGHGTIHTETYEFLDSTYGLILIRYGWILTLIIAALWVWMTHKAYKSGNRRLALAMAVIALHSFSEHHFSELNFNILLAMPLCTFTTRKSQPDELAENIPIKKKKCERLFFKPIWMPVVTATVVGGIVVLLLPRIFSWMRTLFALEGWTGGGRNSLIALLFCLICVGIVVLAWYMITLLVCTWFHEKKVPLLTVLSVITVFVGMGVVVSFANEMILDDQYLMDERIEADSKAVETVLTSAEEPVYGGQMEEIYKRRFKGFSDHLFSDMELARGAKGTILLSHNDEGYQLMNTGAKYTELSPYTGLFTYDEKVIEALQENGYRFHGYYSAEQEIDLPSLGPQNGLDMSDTGELMLWGEAHSLVHGSYLDQYSGNYQVSFSLRLLDQNIRIETPEREICTLRVSALWGQDIRAEKKIYAQDFNEDGLLVTTLDYDVDNTKGVEFLIFCKDDIAVWIRQMGVKKNPPTDIWRTYTKEGFVKSERYFSFDGIPQLQKGGYYGIEYEYAYGNNSWSKKKYLDADGIHLIKNNSGYAQILREYDYYRQIEKETLLDEIDNPCLCTNNYAIIQYSYDDGNKRVKKDYLDTKGNPAMLTDNYSSVHQIYDENKKLLEETYYDVNGKPSNIYGRYAKMINQYSSDDTLELTFYSDADGNPINCGSSYFHEYLQSLKNRNITIFISIRDEGTYSLTDVLLDDLKTIGVRTDLKDKYRYSYYGIITPEGSTENISNTETLTYKGKIGDVDYMITSGGWSVGNISSILLNDEEYSINSRGMNFVILDNETQTVIDKICFDTCVQEMLVTR